MSAKDFHEKPTKKERPLTSIYRRVQNLREELPKCVQVRAEDWDLVILNDECKRLAEYEWMYKELCK